MKRSWPLVFASLSAVACGATVDSGGFCPDVSPCIGSYEVSDQAGLDAIEACESITGASRSAS